MVFAAAAVAGPLGVFGAPGFLEPERHAVPGFADAEALVGVAAGEFEEGEDADFGDVLGFLDEADFGAEFGVADAVVGGAAHRQEDGGGWDDQVELEVGDGAVVDLVGGDFEGGAAGVLAGGVGELEGVHLEVVVFDGVGVVGLEGRAGVGRCAATERQEWRARMRGVGPSES